MKKKILACLLVFAAAKSFAAGGKEAPTGQKQTTTDEAKKDKTKQSVTEEKAAPSEAHGAVKAKATTARATEIAGTDNKVDDVIKQIKVDKEAADLEKQAITRVPTELRSQIEECLNLFIAESGKGVNSRLMEADKKPMNEILTNYQTYIARDKLHPADALYSAMKLKADTPEKMNSVLENLIKCLKG